MILALHLHGKDRLERTSNFFACYLQSMEGSDLSKFLNLLLNDLQTAECWSKSKIFPLDIDFVDEVFLGELEKTSI